MTAQDAGFPDPEIEFCYWHPQAETALHCYQCDKPICMKCAQRTPVGYLCRECVRGRRQQFSRSRRGDYLIAAVTSFLLGLLASVIPLLGSWWFILFLSPLSGTLIAEVVWRLVGRRYGPHLWWIVSAGIVAGVLPSLALRLLSTVMVVSAGAGGGGLWSVYGLLLPVLHVVMAVGTAIARLRLR